MLTSIQIGWNRCVSKKIHVKKPEAQTFAPSFFNYTHPYARTHTHRRARTHAGLSGGGVGWRQTYK